MIKTSTRLFIVFLVTGVMLFFTGVSNLFRDMKTPVDYATLSSAKLQKGMIVEGSVPMNLGAFEENYTTRNGVKSGSSHYQYIIYAGLGDENEEVYMGLLDNSTALQEQLDAQCDATYDYYEGSNVLPQTVYIKGRVMTMDSETQGYMKEALQYIFDETNVDQYMCNYYIKCENYDSWPGFLISGAIILGIAILILVKSVIGSKTVKTASYTSNDYSGSPSAFAGDNTTNVNMVEDDFDAYMKEKYPESDIENKNEYDINMPEDDDSRYRDPFATDDTSASETTSKTGLRLK
ncbi:MAG: DUF6709 family protein [Lachnospiraceae bacterium]